MSMYQKSTKKSKKVGITQSNQHNYLKNYLKSEENGLTKKKELIAALKNQITLEFDSSTDLFNEVCQQSPQDIMYTTKKEQVQYQ